jgi:hypothetical protein
MAYRKILGKSVELYPDDYQWACAQRFNVGEPTIHSVLNHLKTAIKNR